MRHQYHSRKVGEDQYVWDVKKLIALTKNFPIKNIPLNAIQELDEEYWFEAEGSNKPTCRNIAIHFKLLQDADLQYPVILCQGGRVMDGMHRICKALAEGYETIKAVQFETNPQPDYMNVSLSELPYDDDGKVL
jgi:hypothetical protein